MKGLLKDVMMDACKKMEGEEVSELLFFIMLKIMEYWDIAYTEGLLALDEACENACNVPEFRNIFAMPFGFQMLTDGNTDKFMEEVLVTKYWVNNPKGIYAMANYMVIRTVTAMALREYKEDKEDVVHNRYMLEELLTSYLPKGNEKRFESYKIKHFPKLVIPHYRAYPVYRTVTRDKTPKEELMETKPYELDKEAGYVSTVKDKLEKEIINTPVRILEQVVEAVYDGWQLPVVIKYTTNEVREKIFSCLTEEKIQNISDFAVCMGDILMGDIMDAFTYMFCEIIECENKTI